MMRIGREKEAARERERDRERKKRGSRKYGQAKLKHARKGIMSCVLAVSVFLIFLFLFLTAFLSKGQSAAIIGSLGLLTIVLAFFGVTLGLKGMRERDKNYLTCKIGLGINGFIILCLAAVFIRGLI